MNHSLTPVRTFRKTYESLIGRLQTVLLDMVVFEVAELLSGMDEIPQSAIVILSSKHRCYEMLDDCAGQQVIFDPRGRGKTTIFLRKTNAVFLDSDGELRNLQLEIHPFAPDGPHQG